MGFLLNSHKAAKVLKEATERRRAGTIGEGSGIAARHAAWRVLRAKARLR